MDQVYNFSAGPAMLPVEVMRQAQEEFVDWQQSGMSVMEISHRSAEFKSIAEESKQNLRALLQIPENYHILFLHGGGRSQFAMVPMNLLGLNKNAAYVDFGLWGHLAIEEARHYCQVDVMASTRESGYKAMLPQAQWADSQDPAYLYYVDNETVHGMEHGSIPQLGNNVPLVSDMSSNLLSRPFDVSQFGLVFACAQKNLGPAGVTIVIIRDDLLQRAKYAGTPSMFNYAKHVASDSLLNTSPTYPWYMVNLVLKWVRAQGGVEAMADLNQLKSSKLYRCIDQSDFYINNISSEWRSRMNVVLQLHDESLDNAFLNGAAAQGLKHLKGHRSTGGMRASLYNAMPEAGVDALIDYMISFEKQYG